jgi:hypothetical protein
VGAIAVSTHDNGGNLVTNATPLSNLVVYAGTGQFSNFYAGGQSVGLMRSTNGGDTWELVGSPGMAGLPISSLVATRVGTEDIVLVGTIANTVTTRDAAGKIQQQVLRGGGVFRSVDGGDTFTKNEIVAPPATAGTREFQVGSVSDLARDPGNLSRVYAAVIGGGIYESTDAGANWTPINAGFALDADGADNDGVGSVDNATEALTGAARIVLAVQQDRTSATNAVYAALIGVTDWLTGVYRKAPADAAWSLVGTNPPPRTNANRFFGEMEGAPRVTFNAGASPTIVRDAGSFLDDGFLPGGTIAVRIAGANGWNYRIAPGAGSVTATTLTLEAGSGITAAAAAGGVRIFHVNEADIVIVGNPTLTLAAGPAAGTITVTRNNGTWGADGFMVGGIATIAGTNSNNGNFVVTAVAGGVITLQRATGSTAAFVAEPAPSANIQVTGSARIASTPSGIQPQIHFGRQGIRNTALNVDAAGNVFLGGDTASRGTNLYWWDNSAGGQVWRNFVPVGKIGRASCRERVS